MSRLLPLVLCFAVACGSASRPVDAPPPEPRELTNLRAFARLYGVLRFFHPSDEAAALDWNRYAVLGVGRVRGARDAAELEAALEALVAPIAPTAQILGAGEAAADAPAPASTDGLELVAWQHQGPGFDGGQAGVYMSKRTAREAIASTGGSGWTSVSQGIDATPHRGKKFRLRAHVRAGAGVQVSAWARVDRTGGGTGFFDNMGDRMITSSAWTEAVIEGTIDADAAQLVFGGLIMGNGEAWLDDFELTIAGAAVAITNAGFEDGTTGWGGGIGKGGQGKDGYGFEPVADAHAGAKALHVSPSGVVVRHDLFADHAAGGEIAEVDLGGGLRARVPIALWSKDGHTQPPADPAPITGALTALGTGLDSADARIADLIVTWSVFDQFYPYFDVTGADWPAVLDRTLIDALDDASAADHEKTLSRLVAALEDGHGNALVSIGDRAGLPLRLLWADGRVVVAVSSVPEVARGDVLETIDGVDAVQALEAEMALRSGSPQWRRMTALGLVGQGPKGTTVPLRISRDGASLDVTVARGPRPEWPFPNPPIAQLDGGIWYVDLSRAEPTDLDAKMAELAKAPGVVFDLRGYPNGTHGVLNHLMTAPEQDRWMHVAQIVRPALPGAPRPAHAWESMGWDMAPAEPRIAGKAVFLTGGGAISYAESVMGYVEALGLPIVGGPTAGTNGNIRRVSLPTGSSVIFTGMKVTRHDGTRSHLEGIRPTIPLEPTLAGIRAGTDEVLERALDEIREATD